MAKLLLSCFLTSAILLSACSSSDDTVPNQRSSFERYLQQYDLEYTYSEGVYKHIANSDRAGYDTEQVIGNGNVVEFLFEAYTFSSQPSGIIYTNRQEIIDSLTGVYGLANDYWLKDTYSAKIGAGSLIKGLDRGLKGCRNGDSVLLFVSSDLAFGDKMIGALPENSALFYNIKIENVY